MVPPPRFHLVRYHGVLGPCASQRGRVIPCQSANPGTEPAARVPNRSKGDTTGAASRPGAGDRDEPIARIEGKGLPTARVTPSANGGLPTPSREGEGTLEEPADTGEPALRPRRLAWADLLRRVFAVDVLECPRCDARTRLLAAIHPPDATSAILECLGLPPRAPPTKAARLPDEAPDPWDTLVEGEDS